MARRLLGYLAVRTAIGVAGAVVPLRAHWRWANPDPTASSPAGPGAPTG